MILIPVVLLLMWNMFHIPWYFYFEYLCSPKTLIFIYSGLLDICLWASLGSGCAFPNAQFLLYPRDLISSSHKMTPLYWESALVLWWQYLPPKSVFVMCAEVFLIGVAAHLCCVSFELIYITGIHVSFRYCYIRRDVLVPLTL